MGTPLFEGSRPVGIQEAIDDTGTFRQLYAIAYAALQASITDQMHGLCTVSELHQRAALVSELVARHVSTISSTTDVAPPTVPGS